MPPIERIRKRLGDPFIVIGDAEPIERRRGRCVRFTAGEQSLDEPGHARLRF
jgi:hypothetical protein